MDSNTPLDKPDIDSTAPPTNAPTAQPTDSSLPNQSIRPSSGSSTTPVGPLTPTSLTGMDWTKAAKFVPESEVSTVSAPHAPTNEPDILPSINPQISGSLSSGQDTSTTPPPSPPEVVVHPAGSSSSKKPIIIVAIAVLVLVLIGGGAWFLIQSHKKPAVVQPTPTPATISSASNDISSAYDRITSYNIDDFSAGNKQKLVDKYNDLTHDFELEPNSFDDTTTLLALGVASLYDKDPTNKDRYRTELYLLLSWHLKSLPSGITDDTFEPSGNSVNTLKTLQSFKDDNLTQRVMSSMGLQKALNNAVSVLKLKSQTDLSPYEIIAYNFDTDDKKFDELTAKYPLFGAEPKMWTASLDGKEYIMMFKSYAQEVIDDQPNSLAHEFIHAQSAFVEGETGRMVEERRAELFSGNKSAYFDAKQLFIYAGVLSGTDFLDLLRQHPTSSADFCAEVYKKIGVAGTNALAFSWPNAYAGTSSKAMQTIYRLDLQDVLMKETLKIGQKDSAGLKDRVESRYQTLMKVFGNDKSRVIDDLKNNLGGSYGMPTASQYMIDFVNNHS